MARESNKVPSRALGSGREGIASRRRIDDGMPAQRPLCRFPRVAVPPPACLAVLGSLQPPAGAAAGTGLPTIVQSETPPKETAVHPVLNGAGVVIGETTWRVSADTGNCCENHIATT